MVRYMAIHIANQHTTKEPIKKSLSPYLDAFRTEQIRGEGTNIFNLKDFSDDALAQYNLKATHPDHLISDMMELSIG